MTRGLAVALATWLCTGAALAQEFTYEPPGELVPGSGTGRVDDMVYVPDMRFPIEEAPAYPNSQVYGVGGSMGPAGSLCDPRNYSYPWHDNYCETRGWDMPLCPSGTGHQGQDIRAATCDDDLYWAVAAEDGVITSIGSFSVALMSDTGTRHRYLHMSLGSLQVTEGQRVSRGERLGRVSNEFGGTPTSIHLHYDLNQNVAGVGSVYVPTYLSLVESYQTLLGVEPTPCFVIPPGGVTIDDVSECFRQFGPPEFWRMVDDAGVGGSHLWTNAWDGDRRSNWARWSLYFEEAGRYRIEANVVPPYNLSTAVPYMVRHDGTETDLVVDQSAASEWIELGVFDFAAGGDQVVELYDNSGETADDLHITADAVRITPIAMMVDAGMTELPDGGGPMETDAGPEMMMMDEGCTCRATGRGALPTPTAGLLLLGLALWLRQRAR